MSNLGTTVSQRRPILRLVVWCPALKSYSFSVVGNDTTDAHHRLEAMPRGVCAVICTSYESTEAALCGLKSRHYKASESLIPAALREPHWVGLEESLEAA